MLVAEGVETEEQKAMLAQQGCDMMQGYLLSKPLPAATFEQRFLRSGRPKTPTDSGAKIAVLRHPDANNKA